LTKISVFDSSIWIDQWRAGRHSERIAALAGVVRLSSVVIAELWRGVVKKSESDLVTTIERNYPILTPTEKNWLESGRILSKMRADRGFLPEKVRALHFDLLIALTVRSNGATLITSNRADFELIRTYGDFDLEIW
jgi:predicted nucleic acid-binding protein